MLLSLLVIGQTLIVTLIYIYMGGKIGFFNILLVTKILQ